MLRHKEAVVNGEKTYKGVHCGICGCKERFVKNNKCVCCHEYNKKIKDCTKVIGLDGRKLFKRLMKKIKYDEN